MFRLPIYLSTVWLSLPQTEGQPTLDDRGSFPRAPPLPSHPHAPQSVVEPGWMLPMRWEIVRGRMQVATRGGRPLCVLITILVERS